MFFGAAGSKIDTVLGVIPEKSDEYRKFLKNSLYFMETLAPAFEDIAGFSTKKKGQATQSTKTIFPLKVKQPPWRWGIELNRWLINTL